MMPDPRLILEHSRFCPVQFRVKKIGSGRFDGLEWPDLMKKLFSTPVLSFVAGACAMACVILCWMQIHYSRQARAVRTTQRQLAEVQRHQALMSRLMNDLSAYSRTNDAILPLLRSVSLNPGQP